LFSPVVTQPRYSLPQSSQSYHLLHPCSTPHVALSSQSRSHNAFAVFNCRCIDTQSLNMLGRHLQAPQQQVRCTNRPTPFQKARMTACKAANGTTQRKDYFYTFFPPHTAVVACFSSCWCTGVGVSKCLTSADVCSCNCGMLCHYLQLAVRQTKTRRS
jgi:hypothetical protein